MLVAAGREASESAKQWVYRVLRRAVMTGQFEPGEPVPLSYSGGAFSAGTLLMQPFQTALARSSADFVLRTPIHPPHYGAALYALQLAGAAPR